MPVNNSGRKIRWLKSYIQNSSGNFPRGSSKTVIFSVSKSHIKSNEKKFLFSNFFGMMLPIQRDAE